jgi:hypothetical protein
MTRSPWRQPVRIADAVPGTFQRLGLEARFRQSKVWSVWPTVVGLQIVRHAQPHAIWHGRLVVHVTDPVWLHHLSMMRHRVIAALNEKLGSTVVREMVLRVGEVPARPTDPPGRPGLNKTTAPDPAHLARVEDLLAPLGDAPFRDALYRLLLRAHRPTNQGSSR